MTSVEWKTKRFVGTVREYKIDAARRMRRASGNGCYLRYRIEVAMRMHKTTGRWPTEAEIVNHIRAGG